jgi:hypothetical protein
MKEIKVKLPWTIFRSCLSNEDILLNIRSKDLISDCRSQMTTLLLVFLLRALAFYMSPYRENP